MDVVNEGYATATVNRIEYHSPTVKQPVISTPTLPICSFRYARNGKATSSPAQYDIKHMPCRFLNSGISAQTRNVARRNGTDSIIPEKEDIFLVRTQFILPRSYEHIINPKALCKYYGQNLIYRAERIRCDFSFAYKRKPRLQQVKLS